MPIFAVDPYLAQIKEVTEAYRTRKMADESRYPMLPQTVFCAERGEAQARVIVRIHKEIAVLDKNKKDLQNRLKRFCKKEGCSEL